MGVLLFRHPPKHKQLARRRKSREAVQTVPNEATRGSLRDLPGSRREGLCRQQCQKCKRARTSKRKAALRMWLADYKRTLQCMTCGFADSRALTFHHEHREEKDFNVADMLSRGHALTSIRREISKCIVLCANCHRIEHADEWQPAVGHPAFTPATTLAYVAEPERRSTGTRKICRYCLVEQDESCFEICKTLGSKSYRRHKCRTCKRATQSRCKRNRRVWLDSLKQTLHCTDCGFDDYRALEYHHQDSRGKDFAIGDMLKGNRSITAVEREIAKCVVLCATATGSSIPTRGNEIGGSRPLAPTRP